MYTNKCIFGWTVHFISHSFSISLGMIVYRVAPYEVTERQRDSWTRRPTDQLTHAHWHVWLQSSSLSSSNSLSFHFSYSARCSLSVSSLLYTHTYCRSMCYGRLGLLVFIEWSLSLKHTTNKKGTQTGKPLWGSNYISPSPHTHAFRWKHALKAWLLVPLRCHSFVKHGTFHSRTTLKSADWVTDRRHPTPSAFPVPPF